MIRNERLASVILLLVGAPLLAIGLAFEATQLRIGAAIFIALSLVVVAVRLARLRGRARVEPGADSPLWYLTLLVLVPIGFVSDSVTVCMVLAGAVLVKEGLEYAARSVFLSRPA